MKLLSFVGPTGASYGAVEGEKVVDLGIRLGGVLPDLKTALQADALPRLAAAVKGATADYRLGDVAFLPVIANPPRIFCAGLNYYAHRAEGNRPETEVPVFFPRLAESQVGHLQPLVCPWESEQFDYECEVAIVIGKAGRRIPESRALEHIAGMACYNDGSARDWQLATSQWMPGKNFPSTGAFGPWMVTADELPPDSDLALCTRLNGVEMQRTQTSLMTFPMARLIGFVSTFTPLLPGDVILTGTPGGVGLRRNPQVFMQHGDVVEIECEGIGVLRNTVVKEQQP